MSRLTIDPHILEVAEDYKDLEGNSWVDSAAYSDPSYSCEKAFSVTKEVVETSKDDNIKIQLVSTWFKCMVDGGTRILYPSNDEQIRFYYMHFASSYWSKLLIIATIFLLIGPFVTQPVCFVSSSSYDNSGLMIFSGFYVCFLFLHIVDFVILCKSSHINDVFSSASTAPHDFNMQWSIMHFIATLIIIIDLLVYFSDPHNPRIMRCLFPFIYIAKRTNLKSLLGGLYTSISQTIKIYRLLILILLFFSSLGYILFGQTDQYYSNGTHWSTFHYSFLTCLHCFSSRPSVLYRIHGLIDGGNNVSAIYFFVFLTLFTDILFTALIIGTGSKSYAEFKSVYFRTLLKYRKTLLDSIFDLYADDNGFVSLDTWLRFTAVDLSYCSYCIADPAFATTLFQLEDSDNNGWVNKKSFFGLCGILSTFPYNNTLKGEHKKVAGRLKNSLQGVLNNRDSSNTSVGIELPIIAGDENAIISEIIRLRLNSVSSKEQQASLSLLSELSTIYKNQSTSLLQRIYRVCKLCTMYFSLIVMSYRVKLSVPILHLTEVKFDFVLWSVCSAILHVLLIVQLCFVSRAGSNRGWEIVGYLFLLYFYIDNLVQYMASSVTLFTSIKDFVVNTTTFVAKIILSCSAVGSKNFETALTIVILVQSVRSMKLLKFFKGAYLVKGISPIILQVSEILFFIVYFFSIIGHSLFCSVRFIDVPLNTDDDSSAYPNYHDLLNFSSNLQSAYTLAVVAVTSNWSMVMNYASRGLSHGLSVIYYPHIYFYGFRLLMFLVTIPLLASFIIQNFVQQINKRESDSKESKIKYQVTPKTMFRTTLIKSWSLTTRETMSPPPALPDVQSFHELLDDLIGKYRLLQDNRSKATASDNASPFEGRKPITKRIYEIYEPDILSQVSYWIDLYKNGEEGAAVGSSGTSNNETSVCDIVANIQGIFPPTKYPTIAYLWLHDAGAAPSRKSSLPRTERDLFVYKFSRSELLHSLCTLLITIQIIMVLSYSAEDCGQSPRDMETNYRLTIIDFIFIWAHLIESGSNSYLTLSSSFKSVYNWHCLRFLSCLIIFIDCIQFLASRNSVRFSRCLFVVLVVSRLLDLKHYVHSLVIATGKSRKLYTMLVFFLLVLSLEGYLIFQRFQLDPGESRFGNLGMSIASVLHSFTSTPFGLLILKPYFKLSPVSSLFWLTITYALEILGINLLVAVGANQYQKSFDYQVTRRRAEQRKCVINAWFMLSIIDRESETRRLTKESWLQFITLANDSSIFDDLSHLFQYIVYSSTGIMAMVGLNNDDCPLRARLQSRVMHGSILFDYVDTDQKGFIDRTPDFFKLVALHLNNVNSVRVLHLESDISKSDHNITTSSPNSSQFNQFTPQRSSSKLLHLSTGPLESVWERNNVIHYRLFLPRVKSYVSNLFYNFSPSWTERISQACKYTASCHVRLRFRRDISGETVVNPIAQNDAGTSERRSVPSIQREDSISIGFFNIINIIMHVVLASQLFNSIISRNHQEYSEILCGINIYFCVAMIVKMVAMGGENLYGTYYVHRFDFYINVSTVLVCVVQSNVTNSNSSALFPVILLLQVLRFRKIFWIESTFYQLSKVTWSILKIFLLLALIIYFFGVISHDSFCNIMYEVQALGVNDRPSGNTDDTSIYFKFSDVLSFRTYFASLFTLFELGILGSWSAVMDSAALVAPASSYSFFYIFRLTMTLSIFPFLISIIIKVVRTLENENNNRYIIEKRAVTLFNKLTNITPRSVNRISCRITEGDLAKTSSAGPDAQRIAIVDRLSHKCYEILCLLFSPSIPTSSHLSINPNPLIIDLGITGTTDVDDEDDGCIFHTCYYKFRSCYNSRLDKDEFYLKFLQEVLCNNTVADDNTYYNTSLFTDLKSRIDLTIGTILTELDFYSAIEGFESGLGGKEKEESD